MINHKIPVVFTSDERYASYLAVTLQSLAANADDNKYYSIIIFSNGISKQKKSLIKKTFEKNNISVTFIEIADFLDIKLLKSFPVRNGMSHAAYIRLFVPNILKEYDKVVYLDTDILINTDIANLYNMELGNNLLLAVRDIGVVNGDYYGDYFNKNLKIKNVKNYFNSGVLLMNLKLMRDEKLESKFIETAKYNTKYFHDQNILNAVCQGRVGFLDYEWNYIPSAEEWFNDSIEERKRFSEITTDDVKIFHYAAWDKPWIKEKILMGEFWWKYAKTVPFYKSIKRSLNLSIIKYKIKYRFYKFISMITFGKTRKYYKELRNHVKRYIR